MVDALLSSSHLGICHWCLNVVIFIMPAWTRVLLLSLTLLSSFYWCGLAAVSVISSWHMLWACCCTAIISCQCQVEGVIRGVVACPMYLLSLRTYPKAEMVKAWETISKNCTVPIMYINPPGEDCLGPSLLSLTLIFELELCQVGYVSQNQVGAGSGKLHFTESNQVSCYCLSHIVIAWGKLMNFTGG